MKLFLADRVVGWFLKNRRSLPWRKTSNPYRVWVSEVMLQQTTVATVIPYYLKFLELFPSIQSLAESKESDVLKAWQGLGYYRRAKNLRLGAQFLMDKFQGKMPHSLAEILEVPGIGRYTAGAILSIAHGIPTAALDGNLIRVYARHEGIQDAVDDPKVIKRLWKIAESHLPDDAQISREFTEGMMELGALVCRPRQPSCLQCPLQRSCKAHSDGLVDQIPRKFKRVRRRKISELVFWCEKNGQLGFLPTGSDSKFPDFLRLPFQTLSDGEVPTEFEKKFRYSVTDRDFEVYLVRRSLRDRRMKWLSRKQIDNILLPTIDRKIIRSMTDS
jgi:A/G-specific adenine glycosylase